MTTLFERIISTLSDLFALAASMIAVYLFAFKRNKISTAFYLLMSYSRQLTLSDLNGKLDRLNECKATDEIGKTEIVYILHEIEGQINGNSFLKTEFKEVLERINPYTSGNMDITEPIKRNIASQLRESLRTLN